MRENSACSIAWAGQVWYFLFPSSPLFRAASTFFILAEQILPEKQVAKEVTEE